LVIIIIIIIIIIITFMCDLYRWRQWGVVWRWEQMSAAAAGEDATSSMWWRLHHWSWSLSRLWMLLPTRPPTWRTVHHSYAVLRSYLVSVSSR